MTSAKFARSLRHNPSVRVLRFNGGVADFHARAIPIGLEEAEIWVFEPIAPALVLGSSQDVALVDEGAAWAAGLQVVRRSSGGGAVFVAPERSLWIDVVVPRGHRLWSDDVRKSAYWVGQAWARALVGFGLETEVYAEGLESTRWGRLVCFGARGPGEVLTGGRKTVGIAQRRTKDGARFQCIVYDRWDAHDVVDYLVMEDGDREQALADLAVVGGGVGALLPDVGSAVLKELLAV